MLGDIKFSKNRNSTTGVIMSTKLHQIIAVEKGVKQRVEKNVTALYQEMQKPVLFEGMAKAYEKRDEAGEDFPDERQLVQRNASEMMAEIAAQCTELWDIVAQKDQANCLAKADVVVDGAVLLQQVPATHLLFLEKQLVDMQTAIGTLPVLDAAYAWTPDPASGNFKSEVVKTTKMKKVNKPLVLYPATEQHPAQTQLVTEDVQTGTWNTVKYSGAIMMQRKKELLRRVRELIKAVKFAREEANSVEVPKTQVGKALFGYLLS
jgi:hypothetical protein